MRGCLLYIICIATPTMFYKLYQFKSHLSFVTIAKKVSESIVIPSYEQNKKQSKKHMINYSNDLF